MVQNPMADHFNHKIAKSQIRVTVPFYSPTYPADSRAWDHGVRTRIGFSPGQ